MTAATTTKVPVAGICQPRFAGVRRAFERIVSEDTPAGREIGACVAVVLDGVTVVDLWGGWRDRARTRPWEPDTITCMMSVAKASASVCAHVLIDRGLLDPEATVASYWPEFGQAGKARMTVRELLSHRGGVLYADAAPPGCHSSRSPACGRKLSMRRPAMVTPLDRVRARNGSSPLTSVQPETASKHQNR